MRGRRDEPAITPVGTLISLASLDSFPLKGGSLFVTKNHSLGEWFSMIKNGWPVPLLLIGVS